MRIKKGICVGSSDGFWYDLSSGGYIKPEECLEDEKDIAAVNMAIMVLEKFESALEAADALAEF